VTGVQPAASPGQSTSGGAGGQRQGLSQQAQGSPDQIRTQTAHSPAVSLPASLARVSVGMRIEGAIVGRDAEGLPVLETATGAFTVLSGGDLALNVRILLQVRGVGADIRALVLEIDGEPVRPPLEMTLALTGAASQPGPALPNALSVPRPDASGANPLPEVAATGPPPPGSEIAATLVKPAGAGNENAMPRSPWAAVPAPPATTVLMLRVVDPAAPTTPAAAAPPAGVTTPLSGAPAPLVPGTILSGMIVSQSPGGEPLLATPAGLISLQVPNPIPVDTPLTVEVTSAADVPPAPVTAGVAGDAPLAGLRDWPALKEALAVLQASDSALARRILGAAVPTADSRLGSVLLSFFSALGGGDVRRWLGRDAMDALERAGRGDLVRRLADDFGQIARLAGDGGGNDWRTVLFPFYYGNELHQVMLFHRRHGGDGDDEAGPAGTRFIIEVDLNRLGSLRLDGLVRGRRFDLYVRSLKPVPPTQQGDITAIFEQALSTTGMAGSIAFQQVDAFPETPLEDVRPGVVGKGLVV